MQRGRIFKEKPMQMTWVTANGAAIAAKPVEPVVSNVSEDQQPMVQSTGVDDDDEEQEEERSWRR